MPDALADVGGATGGKAQQEGSHAVAGVAGTQRVLRREPIVVGQLASGRCH